MSPAAPVLELLVVAGRDTGQQFTVDFAEMRITRGTPRAGHPGDVRLSDASVSPQQALIRTGADGTFLEHDPRAAHPTLVNGVRVERRRLAPGDRIGVGSVVLEVAARRGGSLSELLEPRGSGQTTEVRASSAADYALRVVGGWPGGEGRRFRLLPERTSLGRGEDADVRVLDRGVSRRHAEIVWESRRLELVHRSRTNPSYVNGEAILGRRPVEVGDEIRLADRVTFRIEPAAPPAPARAVGAAQPSATSLLRHLEDRMQEPDFEERLRVDGSFLDVDVVDSYGLKAASDRPDRIILSFARWRAWITRVVREFEGQVLNSNGDELMCFFESAVGAVRAGSAILDRLEAWNAAENLLPRPFHLRLGLHSGPSLVDREQGIAYSPVLDVAGHLQKRAETDGLLVSEHTLRQLPDGFAFEPAGKLEREGLLTYRLARPRS